MVLLLAFDNTLWLVNALRLWRCFTWSREWFFMNNEICYGWKIKHKSLFQVFSLTPITIIIKACQQHGFPWFSLTIRSYRQSLFVDPLDGIQCLHTVGRTTLVCPCVGVLRKTAFKSSSLLHMQCPSYLDGLCDLSVAFWGVADSRICSK